MDTSQVDNQKPGTYDVTLTTADGQTKIVQVTVLANQQGLTGNDITISIGDEVPTSPSDYGARATDRDGKELLITVDISQVNPQQVGIYPVVLTASDGQTVTVFVHVRAVLTPEGVDEQPTTDDHHPVGESENQQQGAERELLKPPYEQPTPKVGRATAVQHPQSAPAKPAQQGEKASALLPKTGEHTTTLMAVLGFALLGLIGRFVYKRRKH
ncbi:hypothetical protein B807_896 [Fructilactobacillus florum 2F]|nr:hypothetical protein B807_896 [Fructilactobacillus florum 2F]